jgi:hypothetical protein
MCFGTFYSKGGLCTNCKVIRSCKRESLKKLNNDKNKQEIQKIKNNTLERYGPQRAKTILFLFINQYSKPVSTYQLTKEFKKHYTLNVSDTKILSLCKELQAEGRIKLFKNRKGRYWYRLRKQ